jgi:hypothetical protein
MVRVVRASGRHGRTESTGLHDMFPELVSLYPYLRTPYIFTNTTYSLIVVSIVRLSSQLFPQAMGSKSKKDDWRSAPACALSYRAPGQQRPRQFLTTGPLCSFDRVILWFLEVY